MRIYDGNCLNSDKKYLGETSSKNGELIYPKEYNYAAYSLRKDCEIESYRQISPNKLEIIIRGWREHRIVSAVPYGGVFMPEVESKDNYGTCAPRKLVAHCSDCNSDFGREIQKEKSKILKYLKSGQVLGSGRSKVYDHVINEMTGLTMQYYTDGEYEWDSGVIYHFEKYDLKLDRWFVRKAVSQNKVQNIPGKSESKQLRTNEKNNCDYSKALKEIECEEKEEQLCLENAIVIPKELKDYSPKMNLKDEKEVEDDDTACSGCDLERFPGKSEVSLDKETGRESIKWIWGMLLLIIVGLAAFGQEIQKDSNSNIEETIGGNNEKEIIVEESLPKYTIVSVESVYDTEKIKATGTKITTEQYGTYVYLFGKDQDGDEIIVLFENRYNPDINPSSDSLEHQEDEKEFYENVQEFLNRVEAAEGQGVTFEGKFQRMDFTEQIPVTDADTSLEEIMEEMQFLVKYQGKTAIVPKL